MLEDSRGRSATFRQEEDRSADVYSEAIGTSSSEMLLIGTWMRDNQQIWTMDRKETQIVSHDLRRVWPPQQRAERAECKAPLDRVRQRRLPGPATRMLPCCHAAMLPCIAEIRMPRSEMRLGDRPRSAASRHTHAPTTAAISAMICAPREDWTLSCQTAKQEKQHGETG
ncbi:hypothetical protein K432DRAFT_396287 [Lepidopterella palustris CBS 459.81]|uniref:Uncharacterized protein n=1 Tax=Lepidopterella palustris CBS 459.81 TaxID=1314670 RepID=A0A8E2E3A0_9PEZI|nr:hypothetical protein K432DRAFT_396287 [Lepidopterella palustris CBS 459.81]